MTTQLSPSASKKGQSLVEMAVIAPILLIMFIGVLEVGWAVRNFVVAQNATREAARFAARGRYLDFSEIDPDQIGYPYVVNHELTSISGQLPLDVNPDSATGTIIVSHLLVDTGKCGGGTEDDLILTPVTPGYGHFAATYGQPQASRADFAALAEEMRVDNEAFNCQLAARSPGQYIPSVNSVIVVETFYGHHLLVGTPFLSPFLADEDDLIWLYTRTIMRITADARGQPPSAGQGCEVYPIAVHISTLDSLQPGDSTGDIFNGAGEGNFGWLRWNDWPGHDSQGYLLEELQNPRLSHNSFEDAKDPSDTYLNAGDWVHGLTGVVNSNDIRDELNYLVTSGKTIRLPVWDIADNSGGNLSYHIVSFALFRLTAFDLDHKTIQATYVGEDPNACPDEAPPAPPPSGEIIIDNDDGDYWEAGDWDASTHTSGYYGSDYHHDKNTHKGTKTARFTPNISEAGDYQVHIYYASDTDRATNTPVDIHHAGGTATVTVNQRQNGDMWNLLGTYYFDAGTSGYVEIRTDGTDGYVIADAVRFYEN
jgi:hypothetical protein